LVEELLNRGANPDVRDNMGWPVYSAREVVEQRRTPELKALLAVVAVERSAEHLARVKHHGRLLANK
jgi:hypothetical protein